MQGWVKINPIGKHKDRDISFGSNQRFQNKFNKWDWLVFWHVHFFWGLVCLKEPCELLISIPIQIDFSIIFASCLFFAILHEFPKLALKRYCTLQAWYKLESQRCLFKFVAFMLPYSLTVTCCGNVAWISTENWFSLCSASPHCAREPFTIYMALSKSRLPAYPRFRRFLRCVFW